MRIVFLAHRDLIHTVRFTDYFVAKGHDVHLITFEEGFAVNCEVHKLTPGAGPTLLSYLLRRNEVTELLGKLQPDLIDAQQVSSYGNLMATIDYHPWVATALGSDILILPQKDFISKRRIIWALQRADFLTAMSEYMKEKIVSFGLPEEKIVVSCFGIKPEIFHPQGRRIHIPGEPWRLICTRHLEPVYDHKTILDACRQLGDSGLGYILVLIGQGSLFEEVKKASHQPEFEGKIVLKGTLSQPLVAEELRQADIFITASHSDGANISLLEAMACGNFPVVSDIPANRQWGENGKTMLTFPSGDAAKLAQAIYHASEQPDLFSSAQILNYHTVKERGTVEKNMSRLEKVFEELAVRFKKRNKK